MRKVAAVFSILFGAVVLTASTSRTLMKQITDRREQAPWHSWWGNHHVDNAGDLVRMGYLEQVPVFRDTNIEAYVRAGDGNKSVNLYLWGDSYVKNIPDSAFYGLKSFHFGRRDFFDLTYDLDTNEKNVLILSLGERFLRSVFYNTEAVYRQVKRAEKTTVFTLPLYVAPAPKHYASLIPKDFDIANLFNPAVNQNIEYNLFSYNAVTPLRVLKANMNAKLFKRASGDVVISENGDYLFLRQTVLPSGPESSYAPLSNDDISYYISIINQVGDHYRAEGFDEVYISIIPNPVSVIQPALYNNMIPEIQNPQRGYPVKSPVIDVYSEFIQNPAHFYLRGDTHWNHHGREVWLRKVNRMLNAWDSGTYIPKQVW